MKLRMERDDYDIIFEGDELVSADCLTDSDRIPREGAVMAAFRLIEQSSEHRLNAAATLADDPIMSESWDISARRRYLLAQGLMEFIDAHDVSKAIAAEFPDPV